MNTIMKIMVGAMAITAATPGSAATDFTGAGFAIPDGNAVGAQSSVSVGNIGWVTSATISLNGWTHTWIGDLVVTLSHDGTVVALLDRPGGINNSSNVNGDYTLSDTGASLSIITSTFAPGVYQTDNPLSTFDDEDASGIWTLKITDLVTIDTGKIGSWTLSLNTTTTAPGVPEPATWSLMIGGFALAGLQMRRRQRLAVRFA